VEILASGAAVRDYADYKKLVGELKALGDVTDIFCDEVNTKMNGE
jgi:hypothetical protein